MLERNDVVSAATRKLIGKAAKHGPRAQLAVAHFGARAQMALEAFNAEVDGLHWTTRPTAPR